jgi:DNA-binding LytR/AlgR family response regulator
MQYSYVIIDYSREIDFNFEPFEELLCIGKYHTIDSAIDGILEKRPQLIFFNFDKEIPLQLILELRNYIEELPYIVGINKFKNHAFDAIKYGVSDYLLLPLSVGEIRKSILRFIKSQKENTKNKLCLRSNGEYHFIKLDDVMYLKADSNTTDFYLQSNTQISGFKTLKFYENQLPFYFFRIHNSYIVNINYVNRISLGKSYCYIFNNEFKLPFSRTYKENIETIINKIS